MTREILGWALYALALWSAASIVAAILFAMLCAPRDREES